MNESFSWCFPYYWRLNTSASSSSRGSSIDPREVKVAIISSLLVASVFLYAFIFTYLAPPVHTVVIYEVFDVQHPGTLTVVYTRGQGIYRFNGKYSFQIGSSYHIKYTEDPSQRLYYNLLYVEEVFLPG